MQCRAGINSFPKVTDTANRLLEINPNNLRALAQAKQGGKGTALLQRSKFMLPIPGTSSVEHLEENIAAGSVRLTDGECETLAGFPQLVATR